MATYRHSTGKARVSALVTEVIPPELGERHIHGNVTIASEYILRAAVFAQSKDSGLVLLHSHPGASQWQAMSGPDRDTEASYAHLVREITGQPLVGMTLASGNNTWSARHWDKGTGKQVDCTHSTNVRVIGENLSVSWNGDLCPAPHPTVAQLRTLSSWGAECQADLARRRVLVLQRRFLNLVSFWAEPASRKARPQSCQACGQVAMKRCSRSLYCEPSL